MARCPGGNTESWGRDRVGYSRRPLWSTYPPPSQLGSVLAGFDSKYVGPTMAGLQNWSGELGQLHEKVPHLRADYVDDRRTVLMLGRSIVSKYSQVRNNAEHPHKFAGDTCLTMMDASANAEYGADSPASVMSFTAGGHVSRK
jgi:hypothetical protein